MPGPPYATAEEDGRRPHCAVGSGASPLDELLPRSDVRERFETTICAPAAVVMAVAGDFDLESLPLVRAIGWLFLALVAAVA